MKMVQNIRKNSQAVIWTMISFGVFLVVWQIASLSFTGRVEIPGPAAIMAALLESVYTPIGKHTILYHVGISLYRVAIGVVTATTLGIFAGIAMGRSEVAKAIIMPVFELLRPIPPIAWIPLSILWFGLGTPNKVFIIFLCCFNYITMNTFDGACNVDQALVGAARMLGASRRQVLTNIILPSSVPYVFAGLQVAVTTSWSAVVAAEIIHSEEGAGWIITMGMNNGNTIQIMVGMIAIGVIGYILSSLMMRIERRMCRWNRAAK